MNAIARTCRPKELIPIFFFSKFINFFHSSFTRYHLNTAARKQVDPCFPAVYRLTSARVYHGKEIISTEFDTQTVSGGAPATGQRPWSRPGAGQFHRCFVPMPPPTHPDGSGGVSNRRPESILARRSKGAYLSGVRRSHSADLLAERFHGLLDDPHAPIHRFLDRNKARRFLAQPKDYGKPWFGQLMAGPQMLAYFLQINRWMEFYRVG